MATPTFVAAGALAVVTSGNVTPALPSGWAANDIHVLCVMTNQGNTFPAISGWTSVGTAINSADQSSAWYWRRAVGGDTAPAFTIASGTALGTANGLYARIYGFRSIPTSGSPFDNAAMAGTPTSSTTPSSGATSSTSYQALLVTFVVVDDDNTWSSGMPPAFWTNRGGIASSSTGGDAMFDAASINVDVPNASLGATTMGTMSAADFWRTLSLVIKPAVQEPPAKTDPLGLTDASGFSSVTTSVRDQTDALGLTDSITQDFTPGATNHSQTVTDPLGLADDGTVDAGITYDPLGLLDSISVVLGRELTDPAGLLDSITWVTTSARDQTDALGLLDDASSNLTGGGTAHSQTVTDGLGLADDGSVTKPVSYDPLGLTDDVTVNLTLGAITRLITDALGLQDSGTADPNGSVDQITVTDSVVIELSLGTNTLTDTLGLTDSSSQVGTHDRSRFDVLGLVDSVSYDTTTPNVISRSAGAPVLVGAGSLST